MKMAPSFDCVSSLLCAEENSSVFGDDDDDVVIDNGLMEEFDDSWNRRSLHHSLGNRNCGEEIFTGFPLPGEEYVVSMIDKECQHLPATDYLKRMKNGDLDLGTRLEAVDWITKVHSQCNFGPLCLYLSINYLDRFLSAYEIPSKAWMMQLVAVACLALAAKMEETEVPLNLDLQAGKYPSKFIFEGKTVQRMELLVLNTLKWRMQAITPFSFLDYFLKKINNDQLTSRLLIARATQLIVSIFRGIDFLEYRPSEIAAAVAIFVAGEADPMDVDTAMCALVQYAQKDQVIKCLELIKGFSMLEDLPSIPAPSVPQSPIGVLDAACFSYKTDDGGVGSCVSSSNNSPVPKRRKLDL
ncbi:OLC1v1017267C1 [Oldenlandia corymbosa var. corymbosa]|uniref:OLC1v1017267C1 n=1 Tax=Oldenlandia corymbosa var. corymbosa TaxID=529605 RepID=A0AAV1E944_OLDCO|nr:OLC1v1017267C1 [Oldenlandia corymbosa var. corymbosa]